MRIDNKHIISKQSKRKLLLRWTGWFFLGNTFLFWLIGIHYLAVISPFSAAVLTSYGKFILITFLSLAYISHLAALAFTASIPIYALIATWPRRWLIMSTAIILATIAVFALLADTFIFAQYRFHLHGIILKMILSGEGRQIFDFSWLEYLLAAAFVTGILCLEIVFAIELWQRFIITQKMRHGVGIAVGISTCFYLTLLILIFSSGHVMFRPIQTSTRFLPFYDRFVASLMPGKYSLIGLVRYGEQYFLQPQQAYAPLKYPLQPIACTAPTKPLNIVFIVIDTWRFGTLNKRVMPLLHAFAKQALVFKNHYSGGNATRPGIFSLFYAIPPTYWTAMLKEKQAPVFIEELQKQHYQIGIFASASLRSPQFYKTVFASIKNLPPDTPGDNPERRDNYITKSFQKFIQQRSARPTKQPFFAFLFYDAAHSFCKVPNAVKPFKPVVEVCNRLKLTNGSDPTSYFNRYKNALLLVDTQVKKALTTLRQHQLLENTVIVITGDHGQEFNDNHLGYWGHASNYTPYQVETPLIIYWPGKKHNVYDYRTSHYGIIPTLMRRLLGCTTAFADYSVGKSLFNPTPKPYLIIGSYIDFGIVERNRTTTIYPNGSIAINGPNGRPIAGASLNIRIMIQAFKDMRRFYRK